MKLRVSPAGSGFSTFKSEMRPVCPGAGPWLGQTRRG